MLGKEQYFSHRSDGISVAHDVSRGEQVEIESKLRSSDIIPTWHGCGAEFMPPSPRARPSIRCSVPRLASWATDMSRLRRSSYMEFRDEPIFFVLTPDRPVWRSRRRSGQTLS